MAVHDDRAALPGSAYEKLYKRITGLIAMREGNIDDDEVARIVESEIEHFQRSAAVGAEAFEAFANPDDIRTRILSDLAGFSVLDELLVDPDVAEVYGVDQEIIYETAKGETRTAPVPANPQAVHNLMRRLVGAAGENLDPSHPRADGVRVILPNGRPGRLTVSIPPRIEGVVSFTLRIPQKRNATLDDLCRFGSLIGAAANLLALLMICPRVKILVTGPPKAGKTTLIDALLRAIPWYRKVIVCEENRELSAPLLKGEYWQTSQVETLTDLMRSARVANPDVIVLGEMKGPEAWDMGQAANFGCGVIAAVHADSPSLAFESLSTAASPAVPAMDPISIRTQFYRLFDVVVYCDIDGDGESSLRRITDISVVPPQLGGVAVALQPIFQRPDILSPMQLCGIKTLGDELDGKCNRVLRPHGLTVADVLGGAEVRL